MNPEVLALLARLAHNDPAKTGPVGTNAPKYVAPDEQPAQPGVLGTLLGIPGGQGLNADQIAMMRTAGIHAASTAASTARGSRGILGVLNDALNAGRAGTMTGLANYDTMQTSQRAESAREVMSHISDTSPAGLRTAFMTAVRTGQIDTAKVLAEIIRSRGANLHYATGSMAPGQPTQTIGFNPDTGERTPTGILAREPADRPQRVAAMHNGQREYAYLDPQDPTAAPQWTGVRAPEGVMSQFQQRAQFIDSQIDTYDREINNVAPSAWDAFFLAKGRGAAAGLRGAASGYAQLLEGAMRFYGHASFGMMGMRTGSSEAISAEGARFVPQPGDSHETLVEKARRRATFKAAFHSPGGQATYVTNSLPQGVLGPAGSDGVNLDVSP